MFRGVNSPMRVLKPLALAVGGGVGRRLGPVAPLGRSGAGDGGGLVVLGGQGPLVELVLGRVRLGGALDVHEGDRARHRALGRRDAVAPRTHPLLAAARQQFDTLDAAISGKYIPSINNTLCIT